MTSSVIQFHRFPSESQAKASWPVLRSRLFPTCSTVASTSFPAIVIRSRLRTAHTGRHHCTPVCGCTIKEIRITRRGNGRILPRGRGSVLIVVISLGICPRESTRSQKEPVRQDIVPDEALEVRVQVGTHFVEGACD